MNEQNSSMSHEPLVLILIPMFNEELMIKRCIESVCRQTHKNWIIFCQDNASTDGTFSEVVALSQQNTNIHTTKLEKNISASQSFNLVATNGVQRFLSEYVCYLGADDYWENEDYLEKMINTLHASQAVAICASLRLVSEDDSNISGLINIAFKSSNKIFRVFKLLKNRHSVNAIYGIYKRTEFESIIRNGGSLSEYNGSDWWWVYSATVKGKIINSPSVVYRKTIWSRDRRRDYESERNDELGNSSFSKKLWNLIDNWKADIAIFPKLIYSERMRFKELNDWTIILIVIFFAAKSLLLIPLSPAVLIFRKLKISVTKDW